MQIMVMQIIFYDRCKWMKLSLLRFLLDKLSLFSFRPLASTLLICRTLRVVASLAYKILRGVRMLAK